jgi:cell division protein FtsW
MAKQRRRRAPSRKGAKGRPKPPLEYSLLYTATLCLLAAGAVMVYSASSAESLLTTGDSSYFLKRYLIFGACGLAALHLLSRYGLKYVRNFTPLLLFGSIGLTLAVMVPHVGIEVNGARRWLGAGPVQFQPSELLKVALVLYAAQVLATQPQRMKSMNTLAKPLLLVIAAACLLLLKEPDMGTAIVVCLAMGALFIAAGVPTKHLLTITGTLVFLALVFAIAAPYRRARLMSFIHPWHDASGDGFQTVQSMIAIGSGGFFGVGLGESVQKIFYLPEAHTDMILAIIGEELGIFGITAVAALYGMIAYAGLRAAKLARERYAKLLAVGVTSVILCQAILNFFAVMGLAPLTGVPLPFISYGNSNLVVLLGAMGLLLNIAKDGAQARAGKPLRAIEGGKGKRAASRHSRGRDGGPRRAGARGRGRAAG